MAQICLKIEANSLRSGGGGGKQKNGVKVPKKKKSASEVSRAVDWGSGKGGGAWRHAFDAAVP